MPSRPEPPRRVADPVVVFDVGPYLKYMFLCNYAGGRTEVGGYGLHRREGLDGEVIRVHDFRTVLHLEASPAFCSLDLEAAQDEVVKEYMADPSINPKDVLGVWCHTHPDFGLNPSAVDWSTFAGLVAPAGIGGADYAVMVIANKRGDVAAHLRQATAFGFVVTPVPVQVDWSTVGAATIDTAAWAAEYDRNVAPAILRPALVELFDRDGVHDDFDDPDDLDDLGDFAGLARYRLRAEAADAARQVAPPRAPVTYGLDDAPAPRLSDKHHGPLRRRRRR